METTFGNWLKQRRKELGLAQEELAEHIGCSEIMMRKLESGERHPSGQVAQLLADYLHIPGDEREAFITFARGGGATASSSPSDGAQASGRTDQSGSRAPWRSAYIRRTNLPASLTLLIGREAEVAAASDQLLNPKTRLLTMTGAPGIGKTRLALQTAFDLLKHFEDGAFFVDMAPLSDPQSVLPALARTVGLAEEAAGNAPIERLLPAYLRDKRMLLVLDNFEQVLDAAFYLVDLLERCPWLRCLATSREPLHIKGERRFPVPPLPLPEPERLPPLDVLARYPSIELFVERARMSEPDFALSEQNAEAIARICIRLDGLPLAIELAAGQVSYLSPWEIEEHLTGRLQLLKARERYLPERQRSLRGAIDASYNLLAAPEQTLFRRLSVFEGGFTPEAAAAVCAGEVVGESGRGERNPDPDLTERLQTLLDKSLITPTRTANGERRMSMLETIHEYALDRLRETHETELVRRQHAQYYLELSERAEIGLQGAEQETWLARLETEHDNLRAALDWAAASDGVAIGLRMAGALWRFWELRSYDKEGRQRLEKAITLARLQEHEGQQSLNGPYAKALEGAGTLAYKLGDNVSARAMLEECLAIYRTLDDSLGLASALRSLAQLCRFGGELVTARALLDESLSICREAGSNPDIAASLYALGVLALEEGEVGRARHLLEESLALRRSAGDRVYLSKTLIWLGEVARSSGDLSAARDFYEGAFSLHVATGMDLAYLLHNMGHVAHSQGDNERAAELFAESLAMLVKAEDREAIVACLAGLAAVAAGQGQYERAGRLFGATDSLIASFGVHMDVADRLAYEQNLARAQARSDPTSWQAAWAEGQAMTVEQAVTYATRAR
jgi:predicted ATPase/transcriptional regulator with XRE-family HTH domain